MSNKGPGGCRWEGGGGVEEGSCLRLATGVCGVGGGRVLKFCGSAVGGGGEERCLWKGGGLLHENHMGVES